MHGANLPQDNICENNGAKEELQPNKTVITKIYSSSNYKSVASHKEQYLPQIHCQLGFLKKKKKCIKKSFLFFTQKC